MKNAFIILQVVVALGLIILIMMQSKGVGLGRAWGGSGEFYKNRRGVEKIVFNLTIALVGLFLISSILSLIFS